jgi:hypothetical protein
MTRQRRRLITPIVVLTGLFGLGAASAQAASRASEATVQAASTPEPTLAPGTSLIASYQGDDQWNGPRVLVPQKKYQAIVDYTCKDDGFLYLSWNGEPDVFEEAHVSGAKGRVTLSGVQGHTRGYFAVNTWLGCSWTMKVYG